MKDATQENFNGKVDNLQSETTGRKNEIDHLKHKKRKVQKVLFSNIDENPLNEKLKKSEIPKESALYQFFDKHEKKPLNLKNLFKFTDRTNDVSGIGSNLIGIVPPVIVTIADVSAETAKTWSAPVWKISSGMWAVATGVPIIAAFAAAIPAAITAVKSLLGNKGWPDTAINIAVAAVFISAAVLTLAFPIAAPIIAVGVITGGVLVNNLKPAIELGLKVASRKKEFAELKARSIELHSYYGNNAVIIRPLNNSEKHAVLHALEKHLHLKTYHKELLLKAKKLIQQGDINNLETNNSEEAKLIRAALTDQVNVFTMTEFLMRSNVRHMKHLQDEITNLQSKRNSQIVQSINGIATIVGAVMICIPFPPVQIAGAAIVLTTSAIGISIKYDLHGKAWNLMKKGWKALKDQIAPAVKEDRPQSDKKSRLELESRHTPNGLAVENKLTTDSARVAATEPAQNAVMPSSTVALLKSASTAPDAVSLNSNQQHVKVEAPVTVQAAIAAPPKKAEEETISAATRRSNKQSQNYSSRSERQARPSIFQIFNIARPNGHGPAASNDANRNPGNLNDSQTEVTSRDSSPSSSRRRS